MFLVGSRLEYSYGNILGHVKKFLTQASIIHNYYYFDYYIAKYIKKK